MDGEPDESVEALKGCTVCGLGVGLVMMGGSVLDVLISIGSKKLDKRKMETKEEKLTAPLPAQYSLSST
jgi:hypothetical protein